jgi:glycolate oxidase
VTSSDRSGFDRWRDHLPPHLVITDPDVLAGYRTDQALQLIGTPAAVVRVESTAQVQAVLRLAAQDRVPVVTRGAGTGISGGSTAIDGCVVLSTERMRGIEVDADARLVVAQPGALNVEVKQAAAAQGLWYPPDPSSYEICSIGGNVATNAGGLCCVKYGVTADYVLGMEVVLADGTAVRLGGRTVKNVAGLSLAQLFVGSEGILGVITEVTLRLVAPPAPPQTVVAAFPTMRQAAEAVVAITRTSRPSLLELMDRAAIVAVDDFTRMGLDRTAGALLLAQSDLGGSAAEAETALITAACEASGATEVASTSEPEEGAQLLAARRAALPAVRRLGSILLEDVGVPVPQLPDLFTGIELIAASTGVPIPVVAHAGDGNLHPFLVYQPEDPDSVKAAESAFGQVMALALELGGTITGEHGIGRVKAPFLEAQLGADVMALSRRIKHALDPEDLLNPGAVLPQS